MAEDAPESGGTKGSKECFVIGPIGEPGSDQRKHADMLLNAVVREVLEKECGYRVIRADQTAEPGMINDRVIHEIMNCALAVGDVTFHNPNAFYELALRHAARLPVIHFAQAGTRLPFDTAGHRAIIADITRWEGIEAARKELREAVKSVQAPDYRVSNPVTQALASFALRASADPRDKLVAELDGRIRRLERREEEARLRPVFVGKAQGLGLGAFHHSELPIGQLDERGASVLLSLIGEEAETGNEGSATAPAPARDTSGQSRR